MIPGRAIRSSSRRTADSEMREPGLDDGSDGFVMCSAQQARREVPVGNEVFPLDLVSGTGNRRQQREELGRLSADECQVIRCQRRQVRPSGSAVLELVREVALVELSEVRNSNDVARELQREATDRFREACERDAQD